MTADNFEDVDAACKWIGDGPETISREWFAVAVLTPDTLGVRTCIDRLAPFGFVVCGIGRVVNHPVQQSAQPDLCDTRHREHGAQFALCDSVVDIRKDVCLVKRSLFEILLHQL